MPKTNPPVVLSADDVAELQKLYPEVDLSVVLAHGQANVPKLRFSQKLEAQKLEGLAHVVSRVIPGITATAVGAAIRAGHREKAKLTKEFIRHIGSVARRGPDQKKARRDGNRTRAARNSSNSEVSARPGSFSSEAPSPAATATNRPAPHAPKAPAPQVRELPLGHSGRSRPYSFSGKFAGPVYRTGYRSIGEFYDAIKAVMPMAEVESRARAVLADGEAKAAIATLAAADRDIFTAVVRSMGA